MYDTDPNAVLRFDTTFRSASRVGEYSKVGPCVKDCIPTFMVVGIETRIVLRGLRLRKSVGNVLLQVFIGPFRCKVISGDDLGQSLVVLAPPIDVANIFDITLHAGANTGWSHVRMRVLTAPPDAPLAAERNPPSSFMQRRREVAWTSLSACCVTVMNGHREILATSIVPDDKWTRTAELAKPAMARRLALAVATWLQQHQQNQHTAQQSPSDEKEQAAAGATASVAKPRALASEVSISVPAPFIPPKQIVFVDNSSKLTNR